MTKKNYIPFIVIVAMTTLSLLCTVGHSQNNTQQIPDGLFDSSPQTRISAIDTVVQRRQLNAIDKVADLARNDKFPHVRETACKALGNLLAKEKLSLLKHLQSYDANAEVRSAAGLAIDKIKGRTDIDPQQAVSESTDDEYKVPTLTSNEVEIKERVFALGLGSMGGFGVAALNFRFRIPTKAPSLPAIGIEIGAGWTPPALIPVITGMTEMDRITDDVNRWKVISGAGGVLVYLHRHHYIPVRGGWSLPTGGFATLGYGFEQLNPEGFFSWGAEVGIQIQPVAGDWIEKVTETDDNGDNPEVWPVIPYIRFVMHFYLA